MIDYQERRTMMVDTQVRPNDVAKYNVIAAMLEILEPYGIKELVQSGVVAIGRGPRSITDRSRH